MHSVDRWVAAYIENGVVDPTGQSLCDKIQMSDEKTQQRCIDKFQTWSVSRLPSWMVPKEDEDECTAKGPHQKWYNKTHCIGKGSGGAVFKLDNGRAVKVMMNCLERPQRIMYERSILLEIHNAYIVRGFTAWFDDAHRPCIEMELAPYGCLYMYDPIPGMIPWMAPQLHSAMLALRKHKLIHGDLRPANILVFEGRHVKVCDFELALEYECVMRGTWYGFVPPMQNLDHAPECYSDDPPPDEDLQMVDLWGLGHVLYGAYAGKWGASPHDLEEVRMRCEESKYETWSSPTYKAIRALTCIEARYRSDAPLVMLNYAQDTEGDPIPNLCPTLFKLGYTPEEEDRSASMQRMKSLRSQPFITN